MRVVITIKPKRRKAFVTNFPHLTTDEAFNPDDWRDVALQVRNWITMEVGPYWDLRELSATWEADDPLLDAAVYGVLMAWRLTRPDNLA